uniref:Transmembrane protein 120B n=1 Tax=Mola mola TaxID=94237 RepID=A0A3Q3WQ90_MOLML
SQWTTMSKPKFQTEWEEIDEEYQQLQETHKIYRQKLEELTSLQMTCSGAISKQRKCLKDLRYSLTKCLPTRDEKELELIKDLKMQIKEKENVFFDMEAYLPKRNGLYLNLVLGNVNVTLLSNQAKFAYKDEYEKFKLYMTIILMFGAITCLFFFNYRVTDEIFNFLLVWYYCTLTIRESILMSNGSRCALFDYFCMLRMFFLSFVQFLQYYYQSGCLYRLRALGERNQLDLTVEGFQSWMWRGLTFLLPILFFGHFWQLYNSVTLFHLAGHEDCKEWQVFMLALTFLVLFLGNFLTTLKVVHQKIQKNQEKVQKQD